MNIKRELAKLNGRAKTMQDDISKLHTAALSASGKDNQEISDLVMAVAKLERAMKHINHIVAATA